MVQELVTVKIINGVYGYVPAGGKGIRPVFPGGAVEVEAGEAQRLVKLGVAVYTDENTACEQGGLPEQPPTNVNIKVNMQMTAKELRGLLEESDIPFKPGMTKAEMIAALAAAGYEAEDAGENIAPPQVGAEAPVI